MQFGCDSFYVMFITGASSDETQFLETAHVSALKGTIALKAKSIRVKL